MLRHYLPLRPLGSGATGIVFLAKPLTCTEASDHPHLPDLVALKAFRRSHPQILLRSHSEESILSLLLHSPTQSPFLPRLHSAFDDGEFRFLVLDYCSGGDLNSLRHSLPEKRFSHAAIRFYAAEVVLALEHLHALGIIYRDLKPENILLSSDGHIMLSDFDLSVSLPPKKSLSTAKSVSSSAAQPVQSHEDLKIIHQDEEAHVTFNCIGGFKRYGKKRLQGKGQGIPPLVHGRRRIVPASSSSAVGAETLNSSSSSGGDNVSMEARSHSFVGTEEYVAPEVISGIGHEFAVDWWALGVLLFEMAYARTPFAGRTSKQTFHNIIHQQLGSFPGSGGAGSGAALSDLISQLLVKDPSHRLGSYSGAAEVRAHPFFAGVAWDQLLNVLRPPFITLPTDSCPSNVPGFDLASHLVQMESSREEARAKKLQRKQAS